MTTAIVALLLSQIMLAAFLFGTDALDRPAAAMRRAATRRPVVADPLATMSEHRHRLARLGAASQRSTAVLDDEAIAS